LGNGKTAITDLNHSLDCAFIFHSQCCEEQVVVYTWTEQIRDAAIHISAKTGTRYQ